jgi:sulfur-oxidizing protein SoxX
MQKTVQTLRVALSSSLLCGSLLLSSLAVADDVAEGKKIAFDRKKGNCLSCHAIEGGSMAGNIGPPLMQMKVRFPERAILKAQISDSRVNNPTSFMPPFGPHEILTADEIEKVVTFIHSL